MCHKTESIEMPVQGGDEDAIVLSMALSESQEDL